MSTTSTMRINVRLIQASQFLRQFYLKVTHKFKKEHILPNTLSRLASCSLSILPNNHSKLDALFAATLVDMNEEFYNKLIKGYEKDNFWKRIMTQINENHALGADTIPLPFIRGEHLPAHETDPYFGPYTSKEEESYRGALTSIEPRPNVRESHAEHTKAREGHAEYTKARESHREHTKSHAQHTKAREGHGEHTEASNAEDRVLKGI